MKSAKPGIKRIIFHWTAGAGRASALDREHYHRLVEYDGRVVEGKEEIEDNIVTSDDDYARHTLGLNAGSIGVAVCGMMGAEESPFDAGPAAITEVAFRALARLGAELCMTYGIPVTDKTTLTHAEVEPNLGAKQRGKWDITRLPFKPELRGAKACGDYLRTLIKEHMAGAGMRLMSEAPGINDRPYLRKGDRGAMVLDLQTMLKAAGQFPGKIDGVFGQLTFNAVTNVQAAEGITMDGIVGPETWRALRTAEPPPPRDVTAADLRKRGSETVKAADATSGATAIAGVGVTLEGVRGALATVQDGQGTLEWLSAFARENWTLLLIGAALLAIWIMKDRMIAARVKAAVTGENLSK